VGNFRCLVWVRSELVGDVFGLGVVCVWRGYVVVGLLVRVGWYWWGYCCLFVLGHVSGSDEGLWRVGLGMFV
jgi:hypothetical protein